MLGCEIDLKAIIYSLEKNVLKVQYCLIFNQLLTLSIAMAMTQCQLSSLLQGLRSISSLRSISLRNEQT